MRSNLQRENTGSLMLTENHIHNSNSDSIFFNPRPLNSWRESPIMDQAWRYKWDGYTVEIEDPSGRARHVRTWQILEISEPEYRDWEREPCGPVVTTKDVQDYIKEKILRKEANRKISTNIR
jgi:hypothetical protein